MKKLFIGSFLFFATFLFVGCSADPVEKPMGNFTADCVMPAGSISSNSSRAFDDELLRKLSEIVYKEAKADFCQRGDLWGIAGVGEKPCGGPWFYTAYKKINEECFLKVLSRYNQQSKLYNIKYQIGSDCAVTEIPESVICKDGKPVLVY